MKTKQQSKEKRPSPEEKGFRESLHPAMTCYVLELLNERSEELHVRRHWEDKEDGGNGFYIRLQTKFSGWVDVKMAGQEIEKHYAPEIVQDVWTLDTREDADALIALLQKVRDDVWPVK